MIQIGKTLWNRRITMRDGVEVAADIVLPPGEGPWPALVNRTPYMRGHNLAPDSWMRLVEQGYAFVAVDVRGRGDSDGEFTPFVHDAEDGHDVIEWVAAQPWCTGRVGMVGVSYEALTQWWSAKGRPEHLRCIVPLAVGAASEGPRPGRDTGAPLQYWIWWFNLVTGRTVQHPGAPSWDAHASHLPVGTLHEQVGTARKWWPKYVNGEIDYLGPDHALTDEDWAALDIPTLVGVGWWDDQTTMSNWLALEDTPAGPESHLLIGAWDHEGNMAPRPELGGLDVSASVIDVMSYVEQFLARHLKPDVDTPPLPRCRVFRTGVMKWETPPDWPNRDAEPVDWHLGPDGTLSLETGSEEGDDSYRYDPADPVRDLSSLESLAWADPPFDSRYILRRDDVLVFTSDELERQVDVSGRALFEGVVSADCVDTDLAAGLYDVHPDGRSIALMGIFPAVLRLSYRNGADPEPLTPGVPVEVSIPITWLQHSFLPGHRIRLSLTSSGFPFYARNLNSGEPWAAAVEPHVATVTVHRGPESRSRLVLPIEPGAGVA